MKPHQLQLAFLKVLSGSPMEQMTKEHQIVYQSSSPYEVFTTKWISFEEIIRLKNVEEMVEVYYNSGQFLYSIQYLQHSFATPFSFYEALANFYETKCYFGEKLARKRRYEILLEFAKQLAQNHSRDEEFSEHVQFIYDDLSKEKDLIYPVKHSDIALLVNGI